MNSGLILALVAQMSGDLNWWIRAGTALESNMNRVERLSYYTNTLPEAPLFIPSNPAPPGWPSQGGIEFNNVWMKYREDLNPVLKVFYLPLSLSLSPRAEAPRAHGTATAFD